MNHFYSVMRQVHYQERVAAMDAFALSKVGIFGEEEYFASLKDVLVSVLGATSAT